MLLTEAGEFGLIDRIKAVVAGSAENLVVGIDDDSAVFRTTGERLLLLTTDAFVEHVHFDFRYLSPAQLGWRALAANLSDIAAMGGEPVYAVVSLALPPQTRVEQVEAFYQGMKTLADMFGTLVVGGDTTRSPGGWLVSVSVLGEVEQECLTLRSGAKVGDALYVTGTLGGARAGLAMLQTTERESSREVHPAIEKHVKPLPRVKEARYLVQHFAVHAMIDISDGLAPEVGHICRQSGTGATILANRIPLDQATRRVARRLGDDPIHYALQG
ncbi:MAG: thiamine-phosphate kinase, partial [Calditrichaeota bacterium]